MMKSIYFALLLTAISLQSRAQLNTSKLFADHMVLQRNQDVPVWGQTARSAGVQIDLDGQKVRTRADKDGKWQVMLKPMEAGGPYVMDIHSGRQHISYRDVMVGEVWICSGQSNMEFQLKNALGYPSERTNAAQLPIREFKVPDKISLRPETALPGGEWVNADAGTVGDFSAVGYFFAKQLARELHVTVGIIFSSWGGTQAEDWISRGALLGSAELGAAAKALPQTWDGVKQRIDSQLKEYAYQGKPVTLYRADELATEPPLFFMNWQNGNAPGSWEWMGKLYSYRGQGFMERNIYLDSARAAEPSVLALGSTDADAVIYINGKLIREGSLSGNDQLNLPAGTWKAGGNSLLIDLLSAQKSPQWFGMGLDGTSTDLFVHFNDTTVNLADNHWRVMPDLSKPYHFEFLPNNTASMLYNAMINPLIPYAIAGVAWYQGESNVDNGYQYRTTFPLLINDWRSRWKRDFPFLFVQVSSFGGSQSSNIGSGWADLRESQTEALKLPHTGMAVTIDIGDAYNIHPRDKADVGLRLADKALNMVYHKRSFPQCPLYHSVDFKDGYALVSFSYAPNGLIAKDKYGYVRGFEIAGADHQFYYAQAAIEGDTVKVWSSEVPHPVVVRYAWTDAPVDANLYNKEGFPAGPFRTDHWHLGTEDHKFQ